ncbi:Elastin microfibril interfacer [Mactra antiquata]
MVRMEIKWERLDKEISVTKSEAFSALEELKLEREVFRNGIAVFENKIKAEKERVELDRTNMENNFNALSDRIQNDMKDMRESLITPNIVFKARTVKDDSPSVGDTIIFTNVMVNNGGGYDSNTGVFTAPINGTYIFTVHICLHNDKMFHYSIVQDNLIHTSGRFYGDKKFNSCHTADALMRMSVGQRVWLMCTFNGGSNYYRNVLYEFSSSTYNSWNTFSGLIAHL